MERRHFSDNSQTLRVHGVGLSWGMRKASGVVKTLSKCNTITLIREKNWVQLSGYLLLREDTNTFRACSSDLSWLSGVFHPGEMVETTSTSALNPRWPLTLPSPRETVIGLLEHVGMTIIKLGLNYQQAETRQSLIREEMKTRTREQQ